MDGDTVVVLTTTVFSLSMALVYTNRMLLKALVREIRGLREEIRELRREIKSCLQ